MKAIHKYKHAASKGSKEAQRRIAQSMGYKHSIYDDQKMIALLYRAGIEIHGVDYTGESSDATTVITEDTGIPSFGTPVKDTIQL
jgi:hypothetical protein